MNWRLIIVLSLAGYAPTAAADYSYNAKTGALSYTVFNLSSNSVCTFTPYEGNANPSAVTTASLSTNTQYDYYVWSNTASNAGWNSNVQEGNLGFFHSGGNPGSAPYNYVFYSPEDPISSPSPSLTSLSQGGYGNTVEYSTAFSQGGAYNGNNPPAIADSWTITCGASSADTSNGTIVMANMASATNYFLDDGSVWSGSADAGRLTGIYAFYNSAINPPSPGATNSSANPNGAGFVGDGSTLCSTDTICPGNTMNLNSTSTTESMQTGGVWMGVYNPNPNS